MIFFCPEKKEPTRNVFKFANCLASTTYSNLIVHWRCWPSFLLHSRYTNLCFRLFCKFVGDFRATTLNFGENVFFFSVLVSNACMFNINSTVVEIECCMAEDVATRQQGGVYNFTLRRDIRSILIDRTAWAPKSDASIQNDILVSSN